MSKDNNTVPLKTPSERDNKDLLNLICELSGRLAMHSNKHLHDAFWEARKELEQRLDKLATTPQSDAVAFAEWILNKAFGNSNKGVWECPGISKGALTTTELYNIFKQQNSKV